MRGNDKINLISNDKMDQIRNLGNEYFRSRSPTHLACQVEPDPALMGTVICSTQQKSVELSLVESANKNHANIGRIGG